MAIITITTTAAQDAALQRLADRHNAANGTTLTSEQWLKQVILMPAFMSYVRQLLREDADLIRDAWEAADAATRQAVKATLGL
jgi:hypothetical protein